MEENKKRYSDEELEEFRTLILAKLEKAQKEYEELCGDLADDPEASEGSGQKHNVFEDSTSLRLRLRRNALRSVSVSSSRSCRLRLCV